MVDRKILEGGWENRGMEDQNKENGGMKIKDEGWKKEVGGWGK